MSDLERHTEALNDLSLEKLSEAILHPFGRKQPHPLYLDFLEHEEEMRANDSDAQRVG